MLCARCTRFSDQIAGDPFIDLRRARRAAAGRHLRGAAVRVLLLRQHRPDLPGRRADRCRLPVPVPAVRPRVHARRVCEHCASGCAHAHRPPPRHGAAPAGRRRPRRSTRSGTATRAAGPSRTRRAPDRITSSAGPRRRRRARRGVAGPRRSPRAAARSARARRGGTGVLVGGRVSARGRLRLRASSPASCSAPTTSTSGPGRTPPRRPTSSRARRRTGPDGRAVTYADLERARPCCSSASSPRRSRRSSSCGCARRSASTAPPVYAVAPLRDARPRQAGGRLHRDRSRRRGRGARVTSAPAEVGAAARRRPAPRAPSSSSASGSPRSPARSPRRPRPGRAHRRPPGVGAASGGGARRARGRRAARPCCPAAARSPTPPRAPRSPPRGVSTPCRRRPAATPPASSPLPRPGPRRPRRRRRRPGGPRRPGRRDGGPAASAFVVSLELRESPSPTVADVVLPGRARSREGRHLRRLGGPRARRSRPP